MIPIGLETPGADIVSYQRGVPFSLGSPFSLSICIRFYNDVYYVDSMRGSSQLFNLLVGCAVSALSTLIGATPSEALDYTKCDALGKNYAELKAARDAAMESVPGWVDESQDPDGYANWRRDVIAVGDPYDAKMMSIRNAAIAEGCIQQ